MGPIYAWMRRFHSAGRGTMVATQSLRDELKQFTETDGLTGPFWFTPEQTARRTVYIMQMADGKPKLAKASSFS